MPDSQLKALVELSHTLARHPARLALWNEGSCAVKTSAERYFVTPRNAQLGLLKQSDLVQMDFARMTDLAASEAATDQDVAAAQIAADGNAPTCDALLFAYLLGFDGVKIAAHIHPIEINQITCSPRARQFADRRSLPYEVIACGAASVLVPYCDPGVPLAKETRRKMVLWRDRYKSVPKLVLIHNHGMVVLGATPEEILMTTEMTLKSAEIFIGASLLGGPAFLSPNNVSQIEAIKEL